MKIVPGDRVVITQESQHCEDDWKWVIDATVGSTAVAISLEEYRASLHTLATGRWAYSPQLMKERMEIGYEFPFRIETVGEIRQLEHNEFNECKVGHVTSLNEAGIRAIDNLGRLIWDEDTKRFRPGDTVLILNDVIQRQDYGTTLIPAGCEAYVIPVEYYSMFFSRDNQEPPELVREWIAQDWKYPVTVYPKVMGIEPPEGLIWSRGCSIAVLDRSNLQLVSSPYREIEGKMNPH